MFFFTPFDKIQTDEVLLTDIIQRFTIFDEVLNDPESFVEYELKDWDTPESVSKNFYGSDEYSWVILLANRGVSDNPFSCMYASNNILFDFCKEKYGTKIYDVVALKDSRTGKLLDELDSYYYFNDPTRLKNMFVVPLTYFDIEQEKNENSKIIKIIKPLLLIQLESELKNLFL